MSIQFNQIQSSWMIALPAEQEKMVLSWSHPLVMSTRQNIHKVCHLCAIVIFYIY